MRTRMSGLCVVSSTIMSALDGLWRPVFCVFCVMRMMPFAMGEGGVSQFIVCKCVIDSAVLGFAGDVVDDLDTRGVG